MTMQPDTAKAYTDLGAQAHEDILRGVIRDLLGDLRNRRVLDFGCGPGGLSLELAGEGARGVVGVDQSLEMIRAAREAADAAPGDVAERIHLTVGDEKVVAGLGEFDAALCSLALMNCRTRERLHGVLRALLAALTADGHLLAVVTHPCFRRRDYSTFHYELPEGWDYWSSGTPYEVVLTPRQADGPVVLVDYHWTVADYVGAVIAAGGVLIGARELPAGRDADGAPAGPPAYLALLVRRDGRP